jgi:hypothetical protein
MMFLSILAKTYALGMRAGHPGLGLVLWLVSVGIDVFHFRSRKGDGEAGWGQVFRDVALLNLGLGLAGMAVQEAYAAAAVRWKDGWPVMAEFTAFLLKAVGLPVACFDGNLNLTTMAGSLSFAVSFDNLGLWIPASVWAGCGVYLLLTTGQLRSVGRSMAWIGGILLGMALLRMVLATGLFLALCDFIGYESEELPLGPFWKPATQAWMYLPFLLASGPLVIRAFRRVEGAMPAMGVRSRPPVWALGLVLLGLFLVALWEPKGRLKRGNVLINTYHTQWSRTDRPYDRDWYGADSGYNYACLKRWFEVFYDVRELKERIQASDLEGVSVLIIYLPDRPLSDEERRLVVEFVRRGGGLFLIGDHTNVFGSSSHLNEISGSFGFFFRDDVLFDQDEDFFQLFDVPRQASAFLHGMTFFKFRGPASIEATSSSMRPVICLDHAKSVRAIYSVNNFYPPPHDHPSMKMGRFCVSAASRFGQGRVVGFGDSTVFSNFEVFYPGKYEYLINVVHWLNHSDSVLGAYGRRCGWLAVWIVLGWYLVRHPQPRRWLGAGMVVLLAYYGARQAAWAVEHRRCDFPTPIRPIEALFFVADANDPVYVLRAFTSPSAFDQRYDVFIQWVLRTGAFAGFYITGPEHREGLYELMRRAEKAKTGLALIVDGPPRLDLLRELTKPRGAAAVSERLMVLFSRKLEWEVVAKALQDSGLLSNQGALERARAAWPTGQALLEEGKRRILLVFSAERFSDQAMGFSEKVVPDATQRALFNQAFSLVDTLFSETAVSVSPTTKSGL